MIYTSYFANKITDNIHAISIARKTPKYINIPVYIDLAPPFELVSDYKKDHNQARYTIRYILEVLSKLDPHKVVQDLDGKFLLCYERSGEFCHRHIVGKWLNIYTGVDVKEWM